ncbi:MULTISPECIES: hypothetical protein [unclassified Bradyrhizobium]|uniref:hypothetical protein n=1 Tax=unclassified Bradyrhizobium TaxID=2631580 RepID=UPI001FF97E79|nr:MULTISPECIES: hypothetical protein [unclassified Bradyrhizobium]MCK1668883.1 hypothetical protein [Bradyrhizobium sp. 153]MCK1755775.1 hypothetical protein [Bradyrhizobium sp. 137]
MRALSICALMAVTWSFALTTSGIAQSESEQQRHIYQAAVTDPSNKAKVDALVATLIEVPPGSGRYLVEGDILLSRSELETYLKGLRTPQANQVSSDELIVNVFGGRLDYLAAPARRRMTYHVQANTFPSVAAARTAEENFRKAAVEWQEACPECAISFVELSQAEVSSGNVPTFVVKYENVAGGPIARAFFPSSPNDDRQVVIFPGYFDPAMGFDPVGVLRHEIGHILGYRHEHIRNIPGCFTEGNSYKPLTPYTPNSVMHYFCGGAGSLDLTIRDSDKRGHRCLYLTGAPCPQTVARQ